MIVRHTAIAIFFVLGSFSVAHAADFDDSGRVLSVAPQVEQFNQPRQECHTEYVQVQRAPQQQRSVGGSIIGGIAGGLLGNQVGGGNGRTAATAAGAIAGAIAGDRIDNNGQQFQQAPGEEAVQRCRTVDHWENRTNGYNVTYEYHGRTFNSVLPYDPGQRVRLHVAVTPRP